MLPLEQPDRSHVAFDDHRLVANAGLLLPVTLGHHLGLGELVDHHVDLGDAPGRANAGDKLLTLVASALAGGDCIDCIDDADAMRAGGTDRVLGCVVKAPSTLGTFLRSFRWGHVRQLDRVSRELLVRAWAAGAGPGCGPLTIDLDSTIVESMDALKDLYQRLLAENVRIDQTVTHGISCSVYFFDPEDNRVELYYKTGYVVRQGFSRPIDLSNQSNEEILAFSKSFEATQGPFQGAKLPVSRS